MEKVLTRNIGDDLKPTDLAAYEANGGYQGLHKAMKDLSPKDCQDIVSASNLRGRGGAGFPTGMKWSFVPVGDPVLGPPCRDHGRLCITYAEERGETGTSHLRPGTGLKEIAAQHACPTAAGHRDHPGRRRRRQRGHRHWHHRRRRRSRRGGISAAKQRTLQRQRSIQMTARTTATEKKAALMMPTVTRCRTRVLGI